jgi:hypothetical protein
MGPCGGTEATPASTAASNRIPLSEEGHDLRERRSVPLGEGELDATDEVG